jgi:hypothetical protein
MIPRSFAAGLISSKGYLTAVFGMLQDGQISYEEFVSMMRTGTDWRKASRHYSRELFNSLSTRLIRDGSLHPPSYDRR